MSTLVDADCSHISRRPCPWCSAFKGLNRCRLVAGCW